ncbi:hypothetical protein B9Z55_013374 [Caenorhabditis nigoni]|uniref:G-protein coupled receptors family 1 profile domain-containing protein n=1 Tax=Caenorhabditis nigoni TaxID=1611254 RepID=A0A2G5U1F2_9PELO|nr:hypothetical protein B9Z55_013374 [Caenorhabditis nigoni]
MSTITGTEDEYKMHRIIIYSIVLVFEFFGLFGNVNLIAVILRNKILRSNFVHRKSSDIRMIKRKALKTLKVLIVIFLFTRFISTGSATLVQHLKINPETILYIQNYNVIPAVAAYSQNAYVCFFRSEEYRRLLTEQISMYFPCFKNAFPIKSAERSISMKRTTVVVKI